MIEDAETLLVRITIRWDLTSNVNVTGPHQHYILYCLKKISDTSLLLIQMWTSIVQRDITTYAFWNGCSRWSSDRRKFSNMSSRLPRLIIQRSNDPFTLSQYSFNVRPVASTSVLFSWYETTDLPNNLLFPKFWSFYLSGFRYFWYIDLAQLQLPKHY